MSRYSDYGAEEDFPGAAELWRANADRALRGRRGQAALRLLREALENLPAKRLIEGALCTVGVEGRKEPQAPSSWTQVRNRALEESVQAQGEGVCAVGAMIWWKKVKGGMSPEDAFASLPTLLDEDGGDLDSTAREAAKYVDLAFSLAWDLAYENDERMSSFTPEQRYLGYLDFLNRNITPEVP